MVNKVNDYETCGAVGDNKETFLGLAVVNVLAFKKRNAGRRYMWSAQGGSLVLWLDFISQANATNEILQ